MNLNKDLSYILKMHLIFYNLNPFLNQNYNFPIFPR